MIKICAAALLLNTLPAIAAQGDGYTWPVQNAGSWGDYDRNAEWVIRCQPVIVVDQNGISRYIFASPGCGRGWRQ
jgi:hypothetical protein